MDKKERIKEIELLMNLPTFWDDKEEAKKLLKELSDLKENDKEFNYSAVITINSGAGGLDSEDFVSMLFNMYTKWAQSKKIDVYICDANKTEHDGYKNVTFQFDDKKTYNLLKNESGTHRLVRISPFNAKKQRHTSFAVVDVTPKLPPLKEIDIKDEDVEVSFTNSGGPGGQNVNKRETAVRIKHIPSGIIVRVEKERSQAQNKELAFEILRGKLFKLMQIKRVEKLNELSLADGQDGGWGAQVRSYILHPYKLVKDLRVDYEEKDPDEVFNGKIDGFIEKLKDYNESKL